MSVLHDSCLSSQRVLNFLKYFPILLQWSSSGALKIQVLIASESLWKMLIVPSNVWGTDFPVILRTILNNFPSFSILYTTISFICYISHNIFHFFSEQLMPELQMPSHILATLLVTVIFTHILTSGTIFYNSQTFNQSFKNLACNFSPFIFEMYSYW